MKVGALNLDKARDLQEKMAIRMVEKLKKDVSTLSREDLLEEVSSLKKENERVVKILSNEIENQLILKKDHKRILTMNKELVRINEVLTSCYQRSEKRRRDLEFENVTFRRAYNAFQFFLEEAEKSENEKNGDLKNTMVVSKLLKDLSSRYDPDEDYIIPEFRRPLTPPNEPNTSRNPSGKISQKKISSQKMGKLKAFASDL